MEDILLTGSEQGLMSPDDLVTERCMSSNPHLQFRRVCRSGKQHMGSSCNLESLETSPHGASDCFHTKVPLIEVALNSMWSGLEILKTT